MKKIKLIKFSLPLSITAFIIAALFVFIPSFEGAAQNDIIKLFSQGLEKETEGDFISAIFIFQDVLSKNKYFLDAKIALARCYYKTGNLTESEALLKEAIDQDRKNIQARNLLGRVLIALKKFNEAEEAFRSSLEIEPVNIDTKYGLADLYRARGDYESAIRIYNEILKVYPQEVWTYIYLGTSYTEMGQLDRAGGFFRKAVSLDSESFWTHVNLARHYQRMGIYHSSSDREVSKKFFEAAIYEAETALLIDPKQVEAHRILASVRFFNKEFQKAAVSYNNIIAQGSADYLTYYSAGYCYEMLGDMKNAEKNYDKALSMRIDDEITRFRLENVVMSLYREELSQAKRVELSDYHFSKGLYYEDKHVPRKAFLQYKRAIQLDPLDPEKRLKLTELTRADGYYEQYIFELREIIRDTLDVNRTDLDDRIEIYENRISKNLAARWGVAQYEEKQSSPKYFPRTRIRVGVFDAFLSDYIYENFLHPRLSKTISEMLAFTLKYYPKIEVVRDPHEILTPQDAMKKARDLGLDYYISGKLEENEDSLKARLGLFSGFNGKLIDEFEVYFTGNDKVFHTVTSLAEHINKDIPLQGLIVRLEGDRALINIGRAHGVEKDMSFHIFREGKLTKNPETGEYSADPEVSLGRLTVTEVDERISEGTYTFTGLYNRVNIYDNIVLIEAEESADNKN